MAVLQYARALPRRGENVIDVKNAKLSSETKEDEENKTKEVINNVSLLSILNIKEVLKLLFLPQVNLVLLQKFEIRYL